MVRSGLLAVLLLGVGSTALASDRVRLSVEYDTHHRHGTYGFYYADRGRYHSPRHWQRGHWNDHRGYADYRHGWRGGRYYHPPRGYYDGRGYPYPRGHYRDSRPWHPPHHRGHGHRGHRH